MSPSILLRSIAVGLCHCRGPVTLGVVKGGTGVAAATGLGAGAELAATAGHAAAAEERACGQVARRAATALAAAGGHVAAGVVPAGACAHALSSQPIAKIKSRRHVIFTTIELAAPRIVDFIYVPFFASIPAPPACSYPAPLARRFDHVLRRFVEGRLNAAASERYQAIAYAAGAP